MPIKGPDAKKLKMAMPSGGTDKIEEVKTEKVDKIEEVQTEKVDKIEEVQTEKVDKIEEVQTEKVEPEPSELEGKKPLEVEPKKVESKVLDQVKADLQKAAESNPPGDLRREQLTMRATEKDKAEEEREQNKERKAKEAEAKKEAKPKGRPRKIEGDADDQPKKRRRKSTPAEDVDEGKDPAASPKAKAEAKPKAKAKRVPRGPRGKKGEENQTEPDETMVDEIVQLLVHHASEPYDKTKDVAHKMFTKGKYKVWTNIYWNRPAGGVKMMEEGKESQKFYFSYCYSSIAVHIFLCNQMAEKWLNHELAWWQSDDGLAFFRLLLVTAARAEEVFGKMAKD